MTRSSPHMPHLTVCVVLQIRGNPIGAAFDTRLTEGLAVLAKAMAVFTDEPSYEGVYDVEVLVQEDLIILKGRVMSSQTAAPTLKVNLSTEEMQALFEISA